MGGSTRVGPWLGVARIIAKRVRGDDEWEGTYCQVGSPTSSARSSSYRTILESLRTELDIREHLLRRGPNDLSAGFRGLKG